MCSYDEFLCSVCIMRMSIRKKRITYTRLYEILFDVYNITYRGLHPKNLNMYELRYKQRIIDLVYSMEYNIKNVENMCSSYTGYL